MEPAPADPPRRGGKELPLGRRYSLAIDIAMTIMPGLSKLPNGKPPTRLCAKYDCGPKRAFTGLSLDHLLFLSRSRTPWASQIAVKKWGPTPKVLTIPNLQRKRKVDVINVSNKSRFLYLLIVGGILYLQGSDILTYFFCILQIQIYTHTHIYIVAPFGFLNLDKLSACQSNPGCYLTSAAPDGQIFGRNMSTENSEAVAGWWVPGVFHCTGCLLTLTDGDCQLELAGRCD